MNIEQFTEISLGAVEGYGRGYTIEPDVPYEEGATIHITAEQKSNAVYTDVC